jgi:NAD(P)-dependent dehydrogenase (short-subunit alcohol dehydrogenase family)
VVTANRSDGDALVQEIKDSGGKAHFAELDVVNQNRWDAAVVQIKEQAGGLHVLMNIVGSNALNMFPEIDIQTCAPLMRDSGGGSIVNIGSVAGITGNFSTAYSASKWAVEGLSRSAVAQAERVHDEQHHPAPQDGPGRGDRHHGARTSATSVPTTC